MKHALDCLARLIRVLLGQSAVAEKKLACGARLDVLEMSKSGYKCKPTKAKVKKWVGSVVQWSRSICVHIWLCLLQVKVLEQALADGRLSPGDASKLAGRLSWGSSMMFRKLGRAMLRPIFDQKSRRDGQMSLELRRALEWWKKVLLTKLYERKEWVQQYSEPVHLFCDASGSPAHLGAVVFVDNRCCFTHFRPPTPMLDMFKRRRDNQIMGLELLSISLGLCIFSELIRGRNIIVHSDNTGAEAAIRRGSAVAMDHAQLVHAQWTYAALNGLRLHIVRVGTHDNIADLPSRGDFRLMHQLGAWFRPCVLPDLARWTL